MCIARWNQGIYSDDTKNLSSVSLPRSLITLHRSLASLFLTPLNTNNLRFRLYLSHPSAGIKRQRESPDAREHSHNNIIISSRFRLIHCSSPGLSSFRSSPSLPVTPVSLQISSPPRLPSFLQRPSTSARSTKSLQQYLVDHTNCWHNIKTQLTHPPRFPHHQQQSPHWS